jgi:hypothetical protein
VFTGFVTETRPGVALEFFIWDTIIVTPVMRGQSTSASITSIANTSIA